MRVTERRDDSTGKKLAPPYVRISVTVERIENDEAHDLPEGKPGNARMFRKEFDFESMKQAKAAVMSLGESGLEDSSGYTPKLKLVPTVS